MGIKKYLVVSGVLFSLVALAHMLRVLFAMSMQVDQIVVPMFVSWIGLAVAGVLAVWAFRLSLRPIGT